MIKVTAALTEGSEEYNPTKALALVEVISLRKIVMKIVTKIVTTLFQVMKTVTSADFTCTSDEVNNLKEKVSCVQLSCLLDYNCKSICKQILLLLSFFLLVSSVLLLSLSNSPSSVYRHQSSFFHLSSSFSLFSFEI